MEAAHRAERVRAVLLERVAGHLPNGGCAEGDPQIWLGDT